ncbi:hypothetical protein JG687_00016320 [Phytophthora cactorum]|uniref:Uncharacterized protein n=1 Tax=Phytophthora cactorum TaxID=29920 RepID=A0A8T1TWB3_9STRA|nr:hypothetical protein JG687_00016320 [Phytophthora cactorum]
MSSLTKTPAQDSASADSATSVPAQASTSTTESTLSVDEYHALQYKKRVEDKAAAPETTLMPTDYGSDIHTYSEVHINLCADYTAKNKGRTAPLER